MLHNSGKQKILLESTTLNSLKWMGITTDDHTLLKKTGTKPKKTSQTMLFQSLTLQFQLTEALGQYQGDFLCCHMIGQLDNCVDLLVFLIKCLASVCVCSLKLLLCDRYCPTEGILCVKSFLPHSFCKPV